MNRSLGITELIRAALPEWTVELFELTAMLGDEFVVGGVVLLVVGADAYCSVERGSDRLVSDRTAFIGAVVLGGLALTLVLKTTFGLSRPPASIQAIPRESGGFPSGHTMAATVLWTALALWGDRWSLRRRLLAASALIGLVGFSRLALGVHYLVDVVASVGFGVSYLLLAERVTDRDPSKAFTGATLLGVLAVLVTGGTTDGWLAFGGCLGGGAGWWAVTRSVVRDGWRSTGR
ncbi:phosphatase PAP2 family protein [Halopiger djelfimassiliensis]|uniref:phosphatase PAP2 family protein n=1 Tax=Halopiger djelfimassiliensis TaxID=1293047 RepID=UPI00067812E9|nr:phosphatase PAP2 family protein [Halopiger djelfimassiliensis]